MSYETRNHSGHTDTPRDVYVEELIKEIKRRNKGKKIKKAQNLKKIIKESFYDIYHGPNGKKIWKGWFNIDDYV